MKVFFSILNPFILILILVLFAAPGWSFQSRISLDINVSEVSVETGPDALAVFKCRDIQWLNPVSAPQVPWQVMTVLLPPNTVLGSVRVVLKHPQYERVPGTWSVRPAPPEITWIEGKPLVIWPHDRKIMDGCDLDVYQKNAFYPKADACLVATGRMRKWRLAQVALPLMKYNPVSGELNRLIDGTLIVTFDESPLPGATAERLAELRDRIGEAWVRRLAVNFHRQYDAYQDALKEMSVEAGEKDVPEQENDAHPGYVILTTAAIQSASDQLANFVAHKNNQGYDVQVITETLWGGGTGNTSAENIRTWLQANYVIENIEHVLLIGDPDPNDGDVPMKLLHPRIVSPLISTPSDYYYADLTGNWDLDGDNKYGEYDHDFGTGGVDRNWEVMVGRIPYYGEISELDSILERIITYQSQPREQTLWRRNVLLPMDDLGGGPLTDWLGEDIKDDILSETGWSFHRIYDTDTLTVPETMPCTKDNVTDVWGNGTFGLVVWWTHGSATSAQDVIDTSRVDELNDDYKAFTFQASCLTAYPENNNNLTYSLLQHGAICTIGATRESWSLTGHNIKGYATIEGMAYEYAARVVPMGVPSARALNELKQKIVPNYNTGGLWMNYVDCNIYGDPSTSIYMPDLRIHNLTQDRWYPVIEWAMDEAENGDEIVLDPGVYDGFGNRNLDFEGKIITIRSTDPNDPQVVADTVIDAGGDRRIFYFHNDEDENAVINGLTLINSATAIECSYSSPTITNCVFSGNSGAIDLEYSDAEIRHCTFTGNSGYQGGGISSSNGSPEVTDCMFSNNSAEKGGAVYVSGSGEPVVRKCTLKENTASSDGGGFYGGSSGKCTIDNCTISKNTADNYGGGLFFLNEVSLINSIVSGNNAGGRGGGIYSNMYSQVITNCSVTGNRATDYGGGICAWGSTVDIVNSILWGDTALQGPEIALMDFPYPWASTTLMASYSDVQGGEVEVYIQDPDCTLNWEFSIDDDPLFVSPGYWDNNGTPGDPSDDIWYEGDYHLTQDSPCIDVGTNDATDLPETDFEGDLRVVDGDNNGTATVDMGVDEFIIDNCECDLNSDGSCNILDWPYFIEDWGRTDCNEPAVVCECDLNHDGACNILDWPYFIEDWGRTDCPLP